MERMVLLLEGDGKGELTSHVEKREAQCHGTMQQGTMGKNITMGFPDVKQWEEGGGGVMAGKVVYHTTAIKKTGADGVWQNERHGMW